MNRISLLSPGGRFETGRLYLRLLAPEDAPALLDYRQRNRAEHAPWEPVRGEAFFTAEAQQAAIRGFEDESATDRAYSFGVFHQPDGLLIGTVRLSHIGRGPFQNAYVGYSIDAAHGGRGLMTEALRECLRIAFGPSACTGCRPRSSHATSVRCVWRRSAASCGSASARGI